MKTVFYSHTGQVSGAEMVLILLLANLDRERIEPVLACPTEGGLASRGKELGIEHRAVPQLNIRFTWNPISAIRYLAALVTGVRGLRAEFKKIGPAVIHANSIRAGIAAILATLGTSVPVFWHIQDELKLHPFSTCIRIVALMSGRVRLIPASAATGRSFYGLLLSIFGGRIPSKVVYNAVDMERFYPDEEKRANHRQGLSIPEDEFVFGIVGQVTPRKGQLDLVRAFSEFASRPATLLLVGEPMFNSDHEYLAEVKELIADNGLEKKVRILGSRDDIPDIMRSIDALVVNSKSEAFVVVGIEAMAAGTPVIATDVGGIREMIIDRETGLLVPYGDRGRLVAAMDLMMNDGELRQNCSENGKRIAAEQFSATTFVAELEKFLLRENAEKQRATVVVGRRRAKSNV